VFLDLLLMACRNNTQGLELKDHENYLFNIRAMAMINDKSQRVRQFCIVRGQDNGTKLWSSYLDHRLLPIDYI